MSDSTITLQITSNAESLGAFVSTLSEHCVAQKIAANVQIISEPKAIQALRAITYLDTDGSRRIGMHGNTDVTAWVEPALNAARQTEDDLVRIAIGRVLWGDDFVPKEIRQAVRRLIAAGAL